MYCQFFPHRFARFKCIWYSLVFRCCSFLCRKNTAGMNRLKIINYACQGVIHEYENTKRKLLICNANLFYFYININNLFYFYINKYLA